MATRRIETELALSGEKEFNDAMKGVNANLKNIRADMARVTAEFEGNADSIEALTAKEKVLQESIEQHRAKVDALQRMYDEQKRKYGENSAQADKFKLQLTQATTALLKEENALKKTTAAIADKKAADLAAATAAEAAEKAAEEAARAAEEQAKAAEKAAREQAEAAERLAREQKEAAERLAREQKEAAEAAERLAKEQKEAADAAEAAAQKQQRYAEKLERAEKRAEALKKGLGKLGSATAAVAKTTAAGVAAITAAGGVALAGMISMAKEAADAAKAAQEAGEEVTANQQQWLAFSNQLDALGGSVTGAKSAIAGIMLPMLSELSAEGGAFLESFVQDMNAAAGDTEKQTQILGQYIANGAKLLIAKLPEYIKSGKELLAGISAGFQEASPELLQMGEELLVDFLNFVVDKAQDLAVGGLEMVLQLIEGIDGEDLAGTAAQLVSRLVNGLAAAAPKLIPAAVQLVGELVVGLAKNAPALLKSGWDLLIGILDGIISALGEIPKVWREVLDVLISAMRSSDSKFLQFGADIIERITDGILDAWDGLVSWFNGLWDSLFSGREVDVAVNQTTSAEAVDGSHASGLRYVPFDGYLAELHRGEAVLPAAEAAAYRSGQGSGSRILNLTINTTSLAQEDMDMIVGYINRKFGEAM